MPTNSANAHPSDATPGVASGGARPRVFALGIGGTGMLPLCLVLRGLGWEVAGEDDALSPEAADWLRASGIAANAGGPIPADTTLVVHSSAISPQHPRHREATARGLELIRRGHLLARVLQGRRLIAVCGSHGKTTTTALLITALRGGGWSGGHSLGGLFADGATPPGAAGRDPAETTPGSGAGWIVAEVDESDGTIEALEPEITVCTNIDWDHRDHYPTAGAFEAAFERLFRRTRGAVLVSSECPASARIGARLPQGRLTTFGPGGDFCLNAWEHHGARLRLGLGGRFSTRQTEVEAAGFFNALNATAALAAAELSGLPHDASALGGYAGVRRRQSVLLERGGVTVLEDYAHHPTEIRSLLRLLRQRAGDGRLLVVFQPHRHSRTAEFRAGFAEALSQSDLVFLQEVYSAGEAPVAGGSAADVLRELEVLGAGDRSTLLPAGDEAARLLASGVRAGDLLAFVGAGDIEQLARAVVARLDAASAPGTARTTAGNCFGWPELDGKLSAETRLRRDEPLGPRTTLGVGGPASFYAEPATEADLATLLAAARVHGVPTHLLGRGSNLLIPDSGVGGLVLRLAHPGWCAFELLSAGRVRVGAGLRLKQLCGLAVAAGLPGFEFLEGIPGTVGGALRMNAGAMGGWMLDLVEEVRALLHDGSSRTWKRTELEFGYRSCPTLEHAIALEAVLAAKPAANGGVQETLLAYQKRRRETQPRDPSAGCVFRNPEGNSAGRLIDECGLKGLRVGDAEVSTVHANFIVNRGRASAADVIGLVRRVREHVRRERGITLEPEVLLYGSDWKEVLS